MSHLPAAIKYQHACFRNVATNGPQRIHELRSPNSFKYYMALVYTGKLTVKYVEDTEHWCLFSLASK